MNKQIYTIAIALSVAVLSSCSSKPDAVQIKKKIATNKTKIVNLQKEIDSLNNILETDTSMFEEKFLVPVRVQKMKYEPFNHYFMEHGIVEAVNEAVISPEINGQIKAIYIEEGQRVKKGDLLVRLNTDVTRKSIEELQTSLELITKLYDRQKELWEQEIGSEIEFLQAKTNKESTEKRLEALKAQLAMAEIRAPFDGIVDEIYQKTGEMASPGRQVIQLVNLKELLINADISEDYISKISEDKMVEVHFPSYTDYVLNIPIHRTGNVINPANRTFKIQVKVDNKDELIKPNMLAELTINDFSTDSAMVLPSIIIKKDIAGEFIFVIRKNDKNEDIAEKVYIKTGLSFERNTMIIEGLKENDMVVTEGYNTVTSGLNVSIKN